MPYIECEFPVESATQSEVLTALLADFGFEGIEELPQSLRAYIPESRFSAEALKEYLDSFPTTGAIAFTHRPVPDKNWNEAWEQSYEPVVVAGRVRIRASFHPPDKSFEYDLLIDPKMSFGTGHHATTQLMVEMMLGIVFRGKSVLDFGSGTGALAILAHKMGAASVIAIDIDEWALKNITENMLKNDAAAIRPLLGDEHVLPRGPFDFILANVNRNVISANMELLAGRLSQEGAIVFSGLLAGDGDAIIQAAHDNDLILQQKKTKNEWLCLKFGKK